MDNQVAGATRSTIERAAEIVAERVKVDAVILVTVEPPARPGGGFGDWLAPGIFKNLALRRPIDIIEVIEPSPVDDWITSMVVVDRKAYAQAFDSTLVAKAFGKHVADTIRSALEVERGRTAVITMTPNALIGLGVVPSGRPVPRVLDLAPG
jgi:hypothetical protein